jgi:hypothetical protein
MKSPSKGKTASKTKKKAAPKKVAAKVKSTAGKLGCCTLYGSGPDKQIERITEDDCRRRAIAAGKNYQWVAGDCAQPS